MSSPPLKTENLDGTHLLVFDSQTIRLLETILLAIRAIRITLETPKGVSQRSKS